MMRSASRVHLADLRDRNAAQLRQEVAVEETVDRRRGRAPVAHPHRRLEIGNKDGRAHPPHGRWDCVAQQLSLCRIECGDPGRDVGVEETVEMRPDPQPVRGREGAVVGDLISHLRHEGGEPVTRRSRHGAQCGGVDAACRRRRLATQETQEVGVVDSVDRDRRTGPVAACHRLLELGIRRARRCWLPLDTGLDPLQEGTHRGVAGRTLERCHLLARTRRGHRPMARRRVGRCGFNFMTPGWLRRSPIR